MAIRKAKTDPGSQGGSKGAGSSKGTGSAKGAGQKKSSPGKNTGKAGRSRGLWVVLFWLAFAIAMCGLFYFNREAISSSLDVIRNERPSGLGVPPESAAEPAGTPQSIPQITPPQVVDRASPEIPPAELNQAEQSSSADAIPPASQESQGQEKPADSAVAAGTVPQAGASPQAEQGSAELRERSIYLIEVDRSGSILRVKVTRRLPVSDSPMTDVLRSLLSGPNAEERQKGLISLVPPGTRVLSTTVRGSTAYINFSEDFQYNTYGVEGYAGQLRQVVFTATEFPNVREVQILIEGRVVNYLGEGIWMGSPLNRDNL